MKKLILAVVAMILVSCGGGKKSEKKQAPVVGVGQWAQSNFWSVKVDSAVDRITPGMDRYYTLVYASVKNITQDEQPFSLQDLALTVLVEKKDTAEVKYQIDGIVCQSEMKKHSWPVTTTVKPQEETRVILAYSLPQEAKPTLLKVNDGVGPRVTYVQLR